MQGGRGAFSGRGERGNPPEAGDQERKTKKGGEMALDKKERGKPIHVGAEKRENQHKSAWDT